MMISFEAELRRELDLQGADFVYFVDVSNLSKEQNRKLPHAILLGIALSQVTKEVFDATEIKTDRMADQVSEYLSTKGYNAFSQSENSIYRSALYDEKTRRTPLPHKTIAGLAGLGWIGKHDLLVSPEFGSAFSMSSVLTDAPLLTEQHAPGRSQCGDCSLCKDICLVNAIKGNSWYSGVPRDNLIDVSKCNSCFQCAALCPWTQKYMDRKRASEHES